MDDFDQYAASRKIHHLYEQKKLVTWVEQDTVTGDTIGGVHCPSGRGKMQEISQ